MIVLQILIFVWISAAAVTGLINSKALEIPFVVAFLKALLFMPNER